MTEALYKGVYIVPNGHRLPCTFTARFPDIHQASHMRWIGPVDDWHASSATYMLRAEHMSGPLRGGVWWCAIYWEGDIRWSSFDQATPRIKTINAAMWLTELVANVGPHQVETR